MATRPNYMLAALADRFSRPWLMHRPALHAMVARAHAAGNVGSEVYERYLAAMSDDDNVPYPWGEKVPGARRAYRKNGVAIVPLTGPMFHAQGEDDDFTEFLAWWYGGSVTEHFAADVKAALADPSSRAIVLAIDSPGGEVFGLDAALQSIRPPGNDTMGADAAGQAIQGSRKPIVAHAGGFMASAAYYVGSAAPRIVADRNALVGSIGTILHWYDISKMLEEYGIEEVVFRSSQSPNKWADHKTAAGKAVYQREVDAICQVFIEAVAANRGKRVQAVLDDFGQGEVLTAADAVKVGMVDSIDTFDATVRSLAGGAAAPTPYLKAHAAARQANHERNRPCPE